MRRAHEQRINIDIDKRLWHEITLKAAQDGQLKKRIVEKALEKYLKDTAGNN